MTNNRLMIIILISSIVVFSTGAYFKFVKSYSGEELQVNTTSLAGEKIQRQPKLGDMIKMLNELESIRKEYEIKSDENETALKNLKRINIVLISMMILSLFAFIWSIQKLRK
jgi:hypothetical protein